MGKLGNKISKILSIDTESFKVQLKFQDGVSGTIDLSFIFEKPKGLAAEVIRGQLFEKCFIESGSLAWPNGLELCADSLKMSLAQKKSRKIAS
jgi:hypothetical protein